MATEEAVSCITLKAAADLSSYQYYFVLVSAADTVNVDTTGGAACIGVLMNKPSAAGQAAKVAIAGKVPLRAGDTIAAGAKLCAEATTARAITATTGDEIMAVALQAAADGEYFEALISREGIL